MKISDVVRRSTMILGAVAAVQCAPGLATIRAPDFWQDDAAKSDPLAGPKSRWDDYGGTGKQQDRRLAAANGDQFGLQKAGTIPAGHYTYLIRGGCQPDYEQAVDLKAGESISLPSLPPLPPVRRMYISSEAPRTEVRGLPPNTAVDVIRPWTGPRGCTRVVARVVDAGGATAPGTVIFVDSAYLTRDQGPGGSPAEAIAKQKDAQVKADAQRTSKAKSIGEDEVKNGKCSQDRYDNLQTALIGLKQLFGGMSTGGESYDLTGHDVVVATEKGTPLTMKATFGGEQHVYVIGFSPTKLIVRNSDGYVVNMASPYAVVVRNASPYVDSKMLQAKAWEELSIEVVGTGCTLVMVVRHS